MPLGKVAGSKGSWLSSVAVYTTGGALASASVGMLLAGLGAAVAVGRLGTSTALAALSVIAGIAIAREAGLEGIYLLQPHRQTNPVWGKLLPDWIAAALWGLDVGLVFTTWFTFSGVWLLIMAAFMSASPAFAIGLLVAYWAGRAAPVWALPWALEHPNRTANLLGSLYDSHKTFQYLHVTAIALALVGMVAGAWPVAELP